ncbi:putative Cystatin domain-containing protein [Rosa chinensis]|uniref:Putative Cystatin domain-containing protein n=1 Tax=Rosa chinensis TaxID=74649 RepID=A0A2P6RCT4_ROSCH|nr:cysteine proteinase inhibitor 1 [Rosa chinensis]XP_024190327.1 cysteine proteinase inhibitor 1 [Rosa chinensis]PRQ44229.1 putative Cystatin domain-containing protein [Rosa chinensis]PRQ44232.1 putative Cystatin domain-containing protein [Rosa chinensis]
MRHCLLLLLLSHFIAADQLWLSGGWGPIGDLNKPYLKEIAEFAVSEISKQSRKKLVFQSVLKGERQVVRGFNYLLDIEVKDESSPHSSSTVIYKCSVFSGILDEGMKFKGCEILSGRVDVNF